MMKRKLQNSKEVMKHLSKHEELDDEYILLALANGSDFHRVPVTQYALVL